MNLFTHRARSCHEAGICQRTGPQCEAICHQVPAWQGDPPIGYEAARTADVYQLRREPRPAQRAELPTPGAHEWEWLEQLAKKATTYFMAALLALALVGWVLIALHEWSGCTGDGWLARLCWAIATTNG